ncbi:hypothetical protein [Alkalicoccus daliensis]|uniref:Phage-related replication protein YjqB, UPF0714/DUF867 family n=1 Tax=Alkalicoccus daliensis TaxID=745820 RepID=A0A1H0GSZ0_9BACI|nr:hypothetical protein [Alkalicoccus daliensis]SDO10186.1 Phage-related replication protein YjqB, UPF0714/DUF867 family [Alkalicoccus daliensis]
MRKQLHLPCFLSITMLIITACGNNTEDNIFHQQSLDIQEDTEVGNTIEKDWEESSFEDQIFKYEALYSENDYYGAEDAEEPFVFYEGSSDTPVLITAPHSVYHMREEEPKPAEVYTAALARLLHHYTGAHVLAASQYTEDPSHYDDTAFKEKLRSLAGDYPIALIIDLHGAGREHDFHVDIGTGEGANIDTHAVSVLEEYFSKFDIHRIETDHTFPAVKPETIAAFSSRELHISAMQLEIHRSLRDPRNDPEAFYRLTAALSEYITALERSRTDS